MEGQQFCDGLYQLVLKIRNVGCPSSLLDVGRRDRVLRAHDDEQRGAEDRRGRRRRDHGEAGRRVPRREGDDPAHLRVRRARDEQSARCIVAGHGP